ncbi:hypothetical protein RRG08_054839 [Elysia crispata]|uniref:Uncharacterized protein n=1 Tax=Elysia crispata TaxID=231223 RepID=A0AAE1DSP5_9GAST|nr:hypothetical protein RRG08_054839 [Elysia crispata]
MVLFRPNGIEPQRMLHIIRPISATDTHPPSKVDDVVIASFPSAHDATAANVRVRIDTQTISRSFRRLTFPFVTTIIGNRIYSLLQTSAEVSSPEKGNID